MPNPTVNRRTQATLAGGGISAAAQAALDDWISRVQGQGSDVTIAGTRTAVGLYINGLMNDGVWTKIVRHSIYAGDGILALNAPLKNGGTSAVDTLFNFVGGDYSQSTGLTGDTTTKVLTTSLAANSGLMGDNDIHMGIYGRTAGANGFTMGAFNGTLGDGIAINLSNAGTTYFNANNNTTAQSSFVDATRLGFYIGSRTSSSLATLYLDAVSKATNTNAGGSRTALAFFIHALNFNGVAFNWSSQTLENYTVGTALSATDVANFTSRYATLRTALGR